MKLIIVLGFLSLIYSCNSGHVEKKEFYSNGALKKVYNADKKGLIQGEVQEYYETGKLKSKTFFKDGVLNGYSFLYWENGKLQSKGQYSENKGIDTFYFYRENGSKEAISVFDELGRRLEDISYYPSGKIQKQNMFEVGTAVPKVCAYKTYDVTGKLKKNYRDTKFVRLTKNGDSIELNTFGSQETSVDSIRVCFVSKFEDVSVFEQKKRRVLTFKKNEPVRIKLSDLDYSSGRVNIIIERYTYMFYEGVRIPDCLPFYVQFQKDKELPNDNMQPIYFD
ncbi:MAG: hypothetical protein HYZ44_13290 [Bacteroidetes bacterium]|nr:hypothetical protein [Bacteroidota bacterium]